MRFTVTPLPQALGAVVEGLDLDGGLDDATVGRLRQAWFENQVLLFPGLKLSEAHHIALGSVFGSLAATSTADDDQRGHETRGPNGEVLVLDGSRPADRANAWHTDVTFTAHPPVGSLLSMQACPAKGGDTLWSSQYAAYEALSPAIRDLVDGLDAVHGRHGLTGLTTHPMVTTHPETGRRALFVNRGWTTQVVGLSAIESRGLLDMLFAHTERPEFQVRWTWKPGDAALWDNRCTMHYAVNDYGDATRVLHRVTIHDPAHAAAHDPTS
jgi:taurine dioxygenase